MKAEAQDFNLFCCRRQDPAPSTQSYSLVPPSQSLQADRIPEYEYDTMYSRPASSISSTPTYAYYGPQTPDRSRSPMSMNGFISSAIGRKGSPDAPEITTLVARNSYRVKRKTLISPKQPPRSITGTAHFGAESQEPGGFRRSRVGSIDASYMPSLDPQAEADLGNEKALEHEALGFESLKPSPLHVRTYSNAGSFASSVNSHSHSEGAPAYGRNGLIESKAGDDLEPSLSATSKVADSSGPISPTSPVSSSDMGLESAENLQPDTLLTGQRVHVPSPAHLSESSNSLASPTSPPSYSETDLRNRTTANPYDPIYEPIETTPPLPIQIPRGIGIPPSSQAPSNGDDCTLELVEHLPRSERRPLEEYHPARNNDVQEQPSRQPPGIPNHSPKDIESGLELVPIFVPPAITRIDADVNHERPVEPDVVSLRPSIRSSNNKGGSKFGFLRRLGGSKNMNTADAVPPLPENLQYCFSVCSQSLLIWSKKDSDFVVEMKYPFKTGRRLRLGNPRESHLELLGQRKDFSIRFVVASRQITAAYACANKACPNYKAYGSQH
jgi:hypothetical protein